MSYTDFAPATVGDGYAVSHGDDSGLIVEFYNRERLNQVATEREGRPIYREVPYIHIMIPGDKTTDVNRPVQEKDKLRFPAQWRAFEENAEPVLEGTPLEEWALLNSAQRAELKALNIRTVEHLAEINESLIDRLGFGAQKLRNLARNYIEQAKGNVDNARFAREIEKRDNEIDLLKKQVSELVERLGAVNAKAEETPTEEAPPVKPSTVEPVEAQNAAGGSALDALAALPEPTPVKAPRKRGRPRKTDV